MVFSSQTINITNQCHYFRRSLKNIIAAVQVLDIGQELLSLVGFLYIDAVRQLGHHTVLDGCHVDPIRRMGVFEKGIDITVQTYYFGVRSQSLPRHQGIFEKRNPLFSPSPR